MSIDSYINGMVSLNRIFMYGFLLVKSGFVSVLIIYLLGFTSRLDCQPRFEQDEVVTFTDSRWVYSVDFSPRTIYFATNGGLWRLDRFSGESLDPWNWGKTSDRAVQLFGSSIVHWHNTTSTLWLVVRGELMVKQWGTDRWRTFENASIREVIAVGSNNESVFIYLESSEPRFAEIDPVTLQLKDLIAAPPGDVRWSGIWQNHEFPQYYMNDYRLSFNPVDGSVEDFKDNRFYPVFDLVDRRFKRRYICYPGLGIGIVDEVRMRLDIIQPGPTGTDVSGMTISPGGFIWIGGQHQVENGGMSLFDRGTGTWNSFDPSVVPGIDSRKVWDIVTYKYNAYFTTDAGLVCYIADKNRWETLNRFDDLTNTELSAVEVVDGQIIIGGRNGLNRVIPPVGPVFPFDDEQIKHLRIHDIIADKDTFWVAAFQGLYRFDPDGDFELIQVDYPMSGDEAVNCLAINGGALWAGGRHAVLRYDRLTGDWTHYLSHVHLENSSPLSIAANDTLVWIGTDQGLYAGNLNTNSWNRFGNPEGLPSERIQTLTMEVDTLWIGSSAGLTRFRWNRTTHYIY